MTAKGALRIARVMAGEFFFLHSLYVGMVVSVLDFIAMRAGEEKLEEALAFLYKKCIAEQIVSLAGGLDRREALLFIIHNFFLADVSGGAGFPPAGFSVSEDTNSVTVILDPCGSGGELIRHNSYKPLGAMKRALESMENKAMGLTVETPPSPRPPAVRHAIYHRLPLRDAQAGGHGDDLRKPCLERATAKGCPTTAACAPLSSRRPAQVGCRCTRPRGAGSPAYGTPRNRDEAEPAPMTLEGITPPDSETLQ